ncbi:MAG: WYL domain-containing protein [Methanotrichaceae archaeon]|nr:WYL domain-containing protein [Methanotrichaceae archaeon]
MEGYVLPPISFSLYEAMALFLMSRLILRQTDESNPHIQTALTKLSSVLPGELSERLKKSSRGLDRKAANPHYVHIYEQVAVAWATRRRMRILYQSLRDAEGKEWLLDPYLVEMTGVGYSAYVIGMAKGEEREGLTTFKLDRIREAELLGHSFTVPDGLDLEGLLSTGWGVWWGEETEVKLKFSPNVARRVKESIWHPTQVVEDLQDGSCILTVRVGNTLEMTPWIRSWGPDVEVLAPQALRDDFCGWAERLHVMYETKRHKK